MSGRINELSGRVNIKRISESGSTATLRGPGCLAGTSLALLRGKLGLPPQCNVVLVTAICCLKVSTAQGLENNMKGGTHTSHTGQPGCRCRPQLEVHHRRERSEVRCWC
jgi:hypothetical protein